jgi:hypothetical protein
MWRPMVFSQFVSDLNLPLSEIRLESYRPDGGSDLDMLTNYFWNIDLAEAFVPCLHAVEVAVRNSINTAMASLHSDPMWFYKPGLLGYGQLEQLAQALDNLARKRADPTPGRIVAAMTFGFWVALFSGNYEHSLWQPDGYKLLFEVFPHASAITRKQVHTRLNEFRNLRNRIYHHEPIWHLAELRQRHEQIHETIGWISPTLQKAILSVDNFPAIINGRDNVEASLKQHLGIA